MANIVTQTVLNMLANTNMENDDLWDIVKAVIHDGMPEQREKTSGHPEEKKGGARISGVQQRRHKQACEREIISSDAPSSMGTCRSILPPIEISEQSL